MLNRPSEKLNDPPVHKGGAVLRSTIGIVLLSVAGILGLTGVVAAIQHLYRRDIPKTGSEQRVHVQVNAPYGSVAIKAGAASNAVASLVTQGGENDGPALHFDYRIRNHTLGLLRIGIGTDEGCLQQPVVAWRATNPNYTPASASQASSDLGESQIGGANPLGYPPVSHFGQPQFRFVVTDAGTLITPVEPNPSAGVTQILLTKDIPLVFGADFGFGEASVDLGGLSLLNAQIETGASKAQISVGEPNSSSMNSCTVSAGLGECSFTGISNLNTSNFVFNGGVGSYRLGFEGKLTKNLDATVQIGLGRCVLSIPPDAGRVQVFYDDGFLSSYTFSGLALRRDGYATSVGFDRSNSPILTLHLSSGMGKMTIIYH